MYNLLNHNGSILVIVSSAENARVAQVQENQGPNKTWRYNIKKRIQNVDPGHSAKVVHRLNTKQACVKDCKGGGGGTRFPLNPGDVKSK